MTSSSNSAHSLRQKLAHIDASSDALRAQLAELANQRREIAWQLSRVRYSGILSIPREVLGEIFMHCAHKDPIYVPSSPMPQNREMVFDLASVCTEWRAVALGLAPLWANLMLGTSLPQPGVRRILQRSRGYPLNIHFAQGSAPAALIEESSRWASFRGDIERFGEHALEFASLQGRVPSLHTLEIDTSLFMEDLRTMLPITAFVNAPALRRVTMIGLCPERLHVPWHQLTTLDCRGYLDLPRLYNTLRATPNLRNLVVFVTLYREDPSDHARPEHLTLAHLHTLRIQNSDKGSIDTTWTDELTAPSLAHLLLDDYNVDDDLSIPDFIERSQCALKSLHIANISSVEAAKSFLRSIPTLEELRMDGLSHRSAHDIASAILSGERVGLRMLSLRRLHLAMSDPSPVAPLFDFLSNSSDSARRRRQLEALAEVQFDAGYDIVSYLASEGLALLAARGTSKCEFSILDPCNSRRDIRSKPQKHPSGSLSHPNSVF
ncbi:hypothetical protein MKEN_00985200 [Mycena kentingensis (nom. inval.)]|nr:hypothetical protein MKEN_00985200 [Mycena kentingensis (nom. inval.)]